MNHRAEGFRGERQFQHDHAGIEWRETPGDAGEQDGCGDTGEPDNVHSVGL